MCETIERMLEYDPTNVELLERAARANDTLGLEQKALGHWEGTISGLLERERISEANTLCKEAMTTHPMSRRLHHLAAQLARAIAISADKLCTFAMAHAWR